jgi:hypothetical protein
MYRNRAIASAAAGLVLSAALVACGGSGGGFDKAAPPTEGNWTQPGTAATSEEEPTPQATASTTPPGANVGDVLSLIGANGFGGPESDEADVTLLKYNDHAQPTLDIFAAPPGQRLVAAQFTILSTGQAGYDDPGTLGPKAVDSEGNSYAAKPGISTDGESFPININLPPGEKLTAWALINVPQDAKIVAVTYQMDALLQEKGEHVARWNLPS